MTNSNGREPIDQRLDRLTATVEGLVRIAQEQRQSIEEQRREHESLDARLERVITAVVSDSARLDRLLAAVVSDSARLDRLLAAVEAHSQQIEAQSQQIGDLRVAAEAQERRLARLEGRRQ